MKLHELTPPAGSHRKNQRIGRGIAAGQGKTSGKGQKGQKSRTGSSIPRVFEGGQLPLTQRLPKLRGFNNKWRKEYAVVNVGKLKKFDAGSTVDLPALIAGHVVPRGSERVKLLSEGELSVALTVKVDRASAKAVAAVEAAGGKVELTEAPREHRHRDRRKKKGGKAPATTAAAEAPAEAKAESAPTTEESGSGGTDA